MGIAQIQASRGQFVTNNLNLSDSQHVLNDITRIDYLHPNVNLNVNNNDSVNTINCTLDNDCSNFEKKSIECSFVDYFSEGINILCLNCCGLKRRLNYPEFES